MPLMDFLTLYSDSVASTDCCSNFCRGPSPNASDLCVYMPRQTWGQKWRISPLLAFNLGFSSTYSNSFCRGPSHYAVCRGACKPTLELGSRTFSSGRFCRQAKEERLARIMTVWSSTPGSRPTNFLRKIPRSCSQIPVSFAFLGRSYCFRWTPKIGCPSADCPWPALLPFQVSGRRFGTRLSSVAQSSN